MKTSSNDEVFFLSCNMKKLITLILVFFCINSFAFAQELKMYPPNWYKGLSDTTLQLIINYKNIRDSKINMQTDIVKIIKRYPSNHVDYLMIDLSIPKDYLANIIPIEFIIGKKQKLQIDYPLISRNDKKKSILKNTDLMYLIMPDRFANANTSNDKFNTLEEKSVDRNAEFGRHGGDLLGIDNNINYFKSLGITTLWLTPFQENNEPKQSYHGYAITNHYKTDPRLGSNEDYKRLVEKLHQQNMKMCIDLVFNHIGDKHWMYTDKPFPNFIHQFDSFTRTNYRANVLMDPYASAQEKDVFSRGWFDHHMPDLNLKDPTLAKYMIQNTIWWLLYADVDAIRIDTYAYPDLSFMHHWHQSIRKDFPEMSIFGEIWEHAVPLQSFFSAKDTEDKMLRNILDFQFAFAMDEFVNQDFGWTEGVSKMYYNLSQDYLYQDPYHHVTFLDNHDLDRFMSQINGDVKKLKIALGMLLTMRGIPCIFYGTELLMKGKGSHGIIREDFPGGWSNDQVNKFERSNRSLEENEVIDYISKIQSWKKTHAGFSENAKMMQFIPFDGIYAFARYSKDDVAIILYNSSNKKLKISQKKFAELLKEKLEGKNILNDKLVDFKSLEIESKEFMIIDVN